VPLDAPLMERPVGSYLQAMARITEDCAASDSCARWHGDLTEAHAANVERLGANPPDVDWDGRDVPLSAELYVMLGAQLAASPHARLVPAFIRAVAEDDLVPAEAVLNDLPASPIATYVHHAIMCSEELPQNDRARALADQARFPTYASVLPYDRMYAQCEALELLPRPDATPAWRGRVQPLDATVPVLALSGRYDPLSVASNWLDVQLAVPGDSLFVMPDASHAARNSACGAALITRFLENPENGLELPPQCAPSPDFFAEQFELP
jgi:pimeloyl-ACP methyl ester carboxylesterase